MKRQKKTARKGRVTIYAIVQLFTSVWANSKIEFRAWQSWNEIIVRYVDYMSVFGLLIVNGLIDSLFTPTKT